jgi:hypothetical protein
LRISSATLITLDDVPGSLAGAGQADRLFHELPGEVVVLVESGVVLARAPELFRVLLPAFDAAPELLGREVEPELEQQRTVRGQRSLEAAHVGQPVLELAFVERADHAHDDRLHRPGPDEDADPAPRRQASPVTPEKGPLVLLVGGHAERVALDETGIHPLVEQVEHVAARRTVVSGEQHDDGKVGRSELELALQEIPAQFGYALEVLVLVQLDTQLSGFEHPVPPL